MLKPLLVIGVGGSGGKTIRAMKDSLERKLRLAGWQGGLPSAWQFLQIDTVYDGQDFPAKMLPLSEVCVVVNSGDTFEDILTTLEGKGNTNIDKVNLLAGWGIDTFHGNVSKGAGMIRGIGRQVGVAEASKIQESIKTAIQKMRSNGTTDLMQIAQAFKLDAQSQVSAEPEAILITSLSGGSGAGMFMDVAEILKRTDLSSWAQNLTSFLYTAEVFESLKAAGDVRQNCLAAMNEIVAGRYQPVSERTELLYRRLLIPENIQNNNLYSGSKMNILIGTRNASGINIAQDERGSGQNEVFLTIGETLAGVVSDPEIAEWMYTQAFVNVGSSTKIKDSSGFSLGGTNVVQPFMSMGFGRLTLGIDRVSRYVADALTNSQISTLLYPEYGAIKTEQTPDELLKAKVQDLWDFFLANSGLNEKGASANDVTDKLRAQNLDRVTSSFVSEVLEPISSADKPIALNVVVARSWQGWEASEKESVDALKVSIREEANKWVREIQVTFANYIASYVSANGLKTAIGLVEKLISEIVEVHETDLERELKEVRRKINIVNRAWWNDKVVEAAAGKLGLSNSDGNARESLAGKLTSYIKFKEEEYRKELTVTLLRDFQENYLAILRDSLEQEFNLLIRSVQSSKPEENDGLLFSDFPNWQNPIPARYKPRSIEQTLIDPDKFKEFYEKNAESDLAQEDRSRIFEISARSALLGQSLRVETRKDQQFLQMNRPWRPMTALAEGDVPSKVQFMLTTRMSVLREKNQDWLEDKSSAFGKIRNMPIRDYCMADGHKVLASERQLDFVAKYQKMLLLAVPLVTYNKAAIQGSLRNPDGQAPLDSTLKKTKKVPFGSADEIYQSIKGVLQSIGIDTSNPSFDQDWFDDGSRATELYAISVPEGPMPAYAFASLTSPIAKSVLAASSDANLWASYAVMRRARPLQEAIPLTGGALKSMITGWILANMFGLVKEEADSSVGSSLKIWNPTLEGNPGFSSFPSPLLEGSAADNRLGFQLPSVLTSLGLAMVNYGETGDVQHTYAYRFMKFFGREVTTFNSVDDWDNNSRGDLLPNRTIGQCTILKDWIATEEISQLAVNGKYTGLDPSGSSVDRIQRVILSVKNSEEKLRDLWSSVEAQPWSNVPSNWELKEEIFECLRHINSYVEHQKLPEASSTGIGF